MKVVVVDEALPWPLDAGKRIRTFALLSRLARGRDVVLVHPAREPAPPEALAAYAAAGLTLRAVPARPLRKAGPRFAFDLARNLASPLPYMGMAHRHAGVRAAVAREARDADLVHVEWTPLVVNVPDDVGVPLCVSAHNVEADVWTRLAAATRGRLVRAYLRLQARKVARLEAHAVARADVVLAVSERDAVRLRAHARGPVEVVHNGVDTAAFAPRAADRVDPDEIVFVGSLDWRPNVDGVLWFLDEVWPRLRALRPATRAHFVGRAPPDALRARVAAEPGVTLSGSVPDVRPFVARAAVSVVPLRAGGGTRLKICEALAMERPVVSTTVGVEGLDLDGSVVLADAPEAFAAAVAAALDDPEGAAERARLGRARVLERHDWDRIAPVQAAAWDAAAARGRPR